MLNFKNKAFKDEDEMCEYFHNEFTSNIQQEKHNKKLSKCDHCNQDCILDEANAQ